MKDDKEGQAQRKQFSTCLEGSPCAEMMQKIMGKGGGPSCEQMMEHFRKAGREGKAEPKAGQKEEDHGKEE